MYSSVPVPLWHRLSNGVSLMYLWLWMNHSPIVRWPTFRFRFLLVTWCESLKWWRRIFLLVSCIYSCLIHYPSFAYYSSFQSNLLSNSFYTKHFVLTFSIDVVSTLSNAGYHIVILTGTLQFTHEGQLWVVFCEFKIYHSYIVHNILLYKCYSWKDFMFSLVICKMK